MTILAISIGIFLNVKNLGISGLYSSLAGGAISMLLLIIPFAIGGIGGGDVKLTMAIGTIMGPKFAVTTIVYMAISGAIISIIWMISKKSLKKGLSKIKEYLIATLLLRSLPAITDAADMTFPYSLAIASGAVIAYYFNTV